jgi:CelD/BcsL family acetyltransferase involved in cellulose biosynthesis
LRKKARELRETLDFVAIHVRSDECGGSGRPLPFHYWKEGRVVEEQILPHTQALSRATDSSLQIEVVRDMERFNCIASEWDRLAHHCAADPLFLSHTWFQTWWESFGRGNELHVVTVRSRGELVAAAPMMRTQARIYGFAAAALHAIYNAHTPRYDFMVGRNQDPRLYEAIWNNLITEDRCDLIVLAQIPEQSRTIPSIDNLGNCHGWLRGQWMPPASPLIRLGCDYETFFATLGDGCRFNLTKRYARLRRLGPVDVEVVTDRQHVDGAMHDGLRIEAAAWKGENGTAMISDPCVADFYTRLARREADIGQLRLTFLRVAGERIAFTYLLQSSTKLYAVKIGYDPRYHAYSPGIMLLNLILKDACCRGVAEYDLLGGDDEWKFDWTKETRGHRWLFLFRNRLRPRMLHQLKFRLVPGLKGLCRRGL